MVFAGLIDRLGKITRTGKRSERERKERIAPRHCIGAGVIFLLGAPEITDIYLSFMPCLEQGGVSFLNFVAATCPLLSKGLVSSLLTPFLSLFRPAYSHDSSHTSTPASLTLIRRTAFFGL